jgi:hypothetical protein
MLDVEVAARLERSLGLGAFPLIRRRMFQRLQRLAVQGGEPVLQVISQVEMEARGPSVRDKGQYFCWVVKRRLRELGYDLDNRPSPGPEVRPGQAMAASAARVSACTVPPADPAQQSELDRLRLSNELLKRQLDQARSKREGGAL